MAKTVIITRDGTKVGHMIIGPGRVEQAGTGLTLVVINNTYYINGHNCTRQINEAGHTITIELNEL